MANLKSLVLACAVALSSPFVLPAIDADATTPTYIMGLGVTVLDAPAPLGVEVTDLDSSSPLVAQQVCGRGDRILSVAGKSTNTAPELQNAFDQLDPFARVTIWVQLASSPGGPVPRPFTVPARRL